MTWVHQQQIGSLLPVDGLVGLRSPSRVRVTDDWETDCVQQARSVSTHELPQCGVVRRVGALGQPQAGSAGAQHPAHHTGRQREQ
eukprot:COSAG03_NODE_1955_length_3303_cov_2.141386_3_plen_85_part_00